MRYRVELSRRVRAGSVEVAAMVAIEEEVVGDPHPDFLRSIVDGRASERLDIEMSKATLKANRVRVLGGEDKSDGDE